jgi:hypothetical protein
MAENAFAGNGASAWDSGLPDEVIEYRLPSAYLRPNLLRFISLGVLWALLSWRAVFPELFVLGQGVGVAAVYNGVAYFWRRRFRTRVTSEGVKIYGYFTHFVRWRDVQGFEVGGFGESQPLDRGHEGVWIAGPRGDVRAMRNTRSVSIGRRARLGTVYLVRPGGRRILLRAPLVTSWAPDPYFDQKARQLQEMCGQYGTKPLGQ